MNDHAELGQEFIESFEVVAVNGIVARCWR